MNNSSLKTTFNDVKSKNVPRFPSVREMQGNRSRFRPDTTLSNVGNNLSLLNDYNKSYENFGPSGLLGHYLSMQNKDSRFNFDLPHMRMDYRFPGDKGNFRLEGDRYGGLKAGINYEF